LFIPLLKKIRAIIVAFVTIKNNSSTWLKEHFPSARGSHGDDDSKPT